MADRTIAHPPPMLDLGVAPTPLHRLRGLQAQFGGGPELLAKREDLCGVALGGNKLRKLRALLADAAAQRATMVVTTGAVQSNHCAMTAVAAATRGLRAELLLTGPDPGNRVGNLLIAQVAGAALRFLGECSDRERADLMTRRIAELRAAGEIPYPIHDIAEAVRHQLLHQVHRLADATVHVSPHPVRPSTRLAIFGSEPMRARVQGTARENDGG